MFSKIERLFEEYPVFCISVSILLVVAVITIPMALFFAAAPTYTYKSGNTRVDCQGAELFNVNSLIGWGLIGGPALGLVNGIKDANSDCQ